MLLNPCYALSPPQDGDGIVNGDDFFADKSVDPALKKAWRKVEMYVDARHREKDKAKLADMFQVSSPRTCPYHIA